jgi:hypothetical protein
LNEALAAEAFEPGWVADAVTTGALAGALLGGFQALIAGLLLLLHH